MQRQTREVRPTTSPAAASMATGGWRAIVALLAFLAVAALVLVPAPAASAHDSLVSSSPSDGQTVEAVPDHIVLTMNETPVSVGTRVVVRGPDGEVQQGSPRLVKNSVEQALVPGSPAGDYTVVWRVTSRDGHPVSGTFTFTARAAGTTTSSPATPTPSSAGSQTTAPGPTTATGAGQTGTPTAEQTSSTSTGGSDGGGTSWAVWLVIAVLAVAGVGAAAAVRRRGHGERGHG